MDSKLIEKVLIQLQPELAQEFTYAILEDKKKLKALEIIKNKMVDVYLLITVIRECKDKALTYYNCYMITQQLTQEEYELLKEVLLCERNGE